MRLAAMAAMLALAHGTALVAGREAPAVWWFLMAVALTWWAASTVEETEE